MLLKGEGENADHIVGGAEWSTLSHDAFPSRVFDFMLSNPPYGKSWKKDLEAMGGKEGMRDPRFRVMHQGEELSLVTRSSDGQLLFLANLASKMNQTSSLGSRIAEVHNGSSLFLGGAERDQLDPILDNCVALYTSSLDEEGQVKFKGNAKAFCRSYSFLSSILPYSNAAWEKLSIFLNLLTPKLPAPVEEDLSKGILDAIDMDSYRVEKKAMQKIVLQDSDAEIEPIPMEGGGHKPEPELDRLSNILKSFNEHWREHLQDPERQNKRIIDDIAPKVAESTAYRNARENTPHTARMVHDEALGKVMQLILKDDTQFYKLFVENESFRRELGDVVYAMTNG